MFYNEMQELAGGTIATEEGVFRPGTVSAFTSQADHILDSTEPTPSQETFDDILADINGVEEGMGGEETPDVDEPVCVMPVLCLFLTNS